MEIANHIMCRLVDSRVIAPTPSLRRRLAMIVLEHGLRHGLLAFNCVDTHLHLELLRRGIDPREFARRLEAALTRRLGLAVGFARANVKPVLDQLPLRSCFNYIFRQGDRHGVDWDPTFEASNLPDLLGMRLAGRATADNVHQHLPRVRRADLLQFLGVERLVPADGPLELVREAAAAVIGRDNLSGRAPNVLEARRAVGALVGERLAAPAVADLLGVSLRSVTRLRAGPRDARYLSALRLQLALRSAIGGPAEGFACAGAP